MKLSRQIQPIKRTSKKLALSWHPECLWLLNQKIPKDLGSNIPRSFLIEGALDIPALSQSLLEILRRDTPWTAGSRCFS